MEYDVFGVSVKGALHITNGLPCQDYCLVRKTKRGKLFALSDGHGNPNFFRSDVGARLVCEIAVEILGDFADDIYSEGLSGEFLTNPHKFFDRIAVGIIGKWLCAVEKDVAEKEFSEEELAGADKYGDCFRQGKNPEYAYGCTLIAGVMTEDFLLLVQQGDGKCILFDEKGRATEPVPADERCVGNITTSCCDEDAYSSCRFAVINLKEQNVAACIAATDGFDNSFPHTDSVYSYMGLCLTDICKTGIAVSEKKMKKKLSDLSATGSKDDITVCGILDTESVSAFTDKFAKLNEASKLEAELRLTEDKIHSIKNGGKLQYLENSYKEAVDEYGECKKRSSTLRFLLWKTIFVCCFVKIKDRVKNKALKKLFEVISPSEVSSAELDEKIKELREATSEAKEEKNKKQKALKQIKKELFRLRKRLRKLIEKRKKLN